MKELEAFLFGLRSKGVKPGLEPTRIALDELGGPDRSMVSLQIAGSIGKGSTAAMASSLLRAAGIRTGLFTSPHLVRFGERFVIDGKETSSDRIAGLLHRLRKALPWAVDPAMQAPDPRARPLTFFEWATVLACVLFQEEAVEAAVLEVGLGGRLDATTACRADATAITRIDLEHTEILGETIDAIAAEKAGVMRSGVEAVTVDQAPEVLAVLTDRAKEIGTELRVHGKDFKTLPRENDRFDYSGSLFSISDLGTNLKGVHQIENAALAISALEALSARLPALENLSPARARSVLDDLSFPCRFEEASEGLWLDGAHTLISMKALAENIKSRFPGGRANIVFAVLKEKNAGALLEIIRPVAASLTLTLAGGDRATDPHSLLALVSHWSQNIQVDRDPLFAVEKARNMAKGLPVVACGSLYLVGAIRAAIMGSSVDPGDPSAQAVRDKSS